MILLLRYLPWIAGVLVIFGTGIYTGYIANPWHNRYLTLQTADALARAQGEEAIRKDLQSQLAQAQTVSRNNADSLDKLAHENAHITADRDANLVLARRLLARQTRSPASNRPVPQAANKPPIAATVGPNPTDQLTGLVVDVADGYERCVAQLNALIQEIKPQL